jgi:hypothetical protein
MRRRRMRGAPPNWSARTVIRENGEGDISREASVMRLSDASRSSKGILRSRVDQRNFRLTLTESLRSRPASPPTTRNQLTAAERAPSTPSPWFRPRLGTWAQ